MGDIDYLYEQFAISEGPIGGIFLPELNEQPGESYLGFKWEHRLGTPDQSVIPWFADHRNTYHVGVDLPDDGDSFVYRTLRKVDKFIARVRFPGGIQQVSGGADASSTVTVLVEHRRLGTFAWTSLGNTAIARNTRKPVTVQIASDALAGTTKRSPGAVASDASLGGTLAWTSPSNALVSSDTYAVAENLTAGDLLTYALRFSSFGFDQVVPATAAILGVMVEVELSSNPPTGDPGPPGDGDTVYEALVQLLIGGVPQGENRANTTTPWPYGDTVFGHGGQGELWGVPGGITAAQVRSPAFGFAFAALTNYDRARVDAVWMTVYFSDPTTLNEAVREVRVTRVSQTGTPKVAMSFDSIDEIRFGLGLPAAAHPNVAHWGYCVQAGEQLQSRPTASVFALGRTVREITSGLSGALAFDGIDDYVSIPHVAAMATNAWTLEAMVWLEDSTHSGVICGKLSNCFLWWDGVEQNLRAEFRNAADTIYRGIHQDGAYGIQMPFKVWRRVSATFGGSGTKVKLYIDGVLVGETTIINENPLQDTGIFAIGRWGSNPGTPSDQRYFKGRTDDIRYWNVERTQQQILDTLAELGATQAGLVGNWKLNDGSGTAAVDFAGASNGTLTGGPAWSSRVLPAAFGAERYSANPAECLADYLTAKRYALGHWVADADLVLSWWQTAKEHFDEPVEGEVRHRLDLVMDEQRPHSEWIDAITNVCRAIPVESDGEHRLAVDKAEAVSQIFTTANILPGTLRHTWGPIQDRPDQVELVFRNREGRRYFRDAVRSAEILAVANPSFELGGEGWVPETNWTFVSEAANARTGVRSARRDGSVPTPNAALRAKGSVGVPVAGGEIYRADGWILPSGTPNGSASVRLSWRDQNQVEISTTRGNLITGGSGFQRSVAQAAPPPGAFFVVPEFDVQDHTTGIYYAEDLSLKVYGKLPGAAKTKVIDGRGITDPRRARKEADYHLDRLRNLGRFIDWGCALEALGVEPFDVVELALDVPKWGSGGRVADYDGAVADDVVTVDADTLPQGTLTNYQLKIQHDDDTVEVKDVLSVGAPYKTAEEYPRQDVTVSGSLTKAPTPVDARWLFGSRETLGTKQVRVAAASLTRDLDRRLSGFLYDPAPFEPASDPGIDVHAESYLGTGVARTIFLPFTPDLVIIRRRDSSGRTVWRASNWGTVADEFMFLEDSAGWKTSSAYVVALVGNGVNLGTDAEVNTSGGTYDLVAFRVGSRFAVGSYTGDGVAGGQTVALPFSPEMIWVCGKGGTTRDTIWRVRTLGSTESWSIKNSVAVAAAKGIESTGGSSFKARGTAAGLTDMNASGQAYVWAAWGRSIYNARLVSFAGNDADGRYITAAIPRAVWAWLQTVEESAPDQGGFWRIGGYDATDLAGQVVSAAMKADVMERLYADNPQPGSMSVAMGTKGNKIHASKSNHLFVAYELGAP